MKKSAIIAITVVIILIITGLIIFNLIKHYTSDEYQLGKIGYNEKEVSVLLKTDEKTINKALIKYDQDLISLTKQKYFLWKNYNTYKEYITKLDKANKDIDYMDIVTKVNVKSNYEPYTHTKKTNMKKGNAIMVNKYNSLPSKYAPTDIVKVSNWYAYGEANIRTEVYEAYKEMFSAAKDAGYTIIINSGYRTYEYQEKVYNQYKDDKGEEYADSYAARPDYSEHQTGLALDVIAPGTAGKDFENTDHFKWLQKNAYKYGFILRYPKDKEKITGYAYESWHYRYLGKDLAKKVYKSDLTYDEYYAYYLDK